MRYRPRLFALALVASIPFLVDARADVVETKDGTVYEGEITKQGDAEIVIETTFDGVKTVSRDNVKRIDESVPPLRKQLAYRAGQAKNDVKALWKLHRWAKSAGFESELNEILEQIIKIKPKDVRARKYLGHIKIDGKWMSPEEKKQADEAAKVEEYKAKGLVEYKGEWVTPEERDARQKGMRKDGDTWVTDDEWHERRGYKKHEGKWVRVGEEAGKKFVKEAKFGSRLEYGYRWSGHVDVVYRIPGSMAERVAEAAEKAFTVFRRILRPTAEDLPDDGSERAFLMLFEKSEPYGAFADWFQKRVKANKLIPGWGDAVKRQHTFWWAQDPNLVCVYQFPNTDKTFVSNVVHSYSNVLLTRYKMNYKFPSQWLLQGFAYHLEMQSIGYSSTFTLGRGEDSVVGGGEGEILKWSDTAKWRDALKLAVAEGSDSPLRRIAKFGQANFRYPQLAKAWSVVEYLTRLSPEKFKKFIDLSKVRDKPEEDALQEAYGFDYRKLDRKWRAYVEAGFLIK